MMEMLTRNAFRILLGLCIVLAVTGLFFRTESGPESFPLLYPLVGLISVGVVIAVVRLLAPILRTDAGDDDAD